MTFKKNYPPQFAQCVFRKNNAVASINGSDYDLKLWLNYHCSYEWDMNKSLTTLFLYTDIKKDFQKSMNTNSIKSALEKIDGMEFEMNYLKSYGSKTKQSYVPFSITILTDAASEKSYGFEVTVDKTYISLFTNPSPKVTLEYSNTTVLTQSTYKKLYLLLRDALGKNTSTTRIIDIEDLRDLLNVANATNTQVVKTIKKAIKAITDNTNLQATCIVEKKLTKSGSREIDKVRFRLYKQATPQSTINATQIIQATPTVVIQPAVSTPPAPIAQVAVTSNDEEIQVKDSEYDRLLEEFVDRKVDLLANKRSNIGNIKSWKNGTKENLMDDEKTIDEFDIFYELHLQKQKILSDTNYDSSSMIALTDPEDDTIRYVVNEKYQVTDIHLVVIIDKVTEVLDFLEEKYIDGFDWKVMSCSNLKTYKLMAF